MKGRAQTLKLSEVHLLRLRATLHTLPHFYERTYVKITVEIHLCRQASFGQVLLSRYFGTLLSRYVVPRS